MVRNFVNNGLVIGVILLFFGASFVPYIFVGNAKADFLIRDEGDMNNCVSDSANEDHTPNLKLEIQQSAYDIGYIEIVVGGGSFANVCAGISDLMNAGDYVAELEVDYGNLPWNWRYYGTWCARIIVGDIEFFDLLIDFDYSNQSPPEDFIIDRMETIPAGTYNWYFYAGVDNFVYHWENGRWKFDHLEEVWDYEDGIAIFPVDTQVTFSLKIKNPYNTLFKQFMDYLTYMDSILKIQLKNGMEYEKL